MGRPRSLARTEGRIERPDIYKYQDFRLFLKDWLAFLRSKDPKLTPRAIALKSEMSVSGLSMVLSGTRNFSIRSLAKLLPQLQLKPPEQVYFESLVRLGTIDLQEGRLHELNRISKLPTYQKRNPQEARFFQYIGNWYHVAIRELAALPGFQADPEWISERLRYRLPLQTIRSALEFLVNNGFLKVDEQGVSPATGDTFNCAGPVYMAAMTQYHKQMFHLATESIEATPAPERDIQGFTLPLSPKRLEKARQIVQKALDEIEALQKTGDEPTDTVYQVELALFPLAASKGGKS